jgi:mycothiol system anti-sigma-R factor
MKQARNTGCRQALEHLFVYIDEQLSRGKRREMEHHLIQCQACSDRIEFERQLKTRLRGIGQHSVPAALERRIKELLESL